LHPITRWLKIFHIKNYGQVLVFLLIIEDGSSTVGLPKYCLNSWDCPPFIREPSQGRTKHGDSQGHTKSGQDEKHKSGANQSGTKRSQDGGVT
jgi:hypothetical protein